MTVTLHSNYSTKTIIEDYKPNPSIRVMELTASLFNAVKQYHLENPSEPGLYRECSTAHAIEKTLKEVTISSTPTINVDDFRTNTGVIKKLIREMEPRLLASCFDEIIESVNVGGAPINIDTCLAKVPEENQRLLFKLIDHLRSISDDDNARLNNLVSIFAPSLFPDSPTTNFNTSWHLQGAQQRLLSGLIKKHQSLHPR